MTTSLVLADVNAAIAADVDAAVAAGAGLRLVGFSARETGAGEGAVATARIMNGATGAGGTEIVAIELAANESKFKWFWPGVDSANGISVDHIAGTLDITIFYTIVP